MAVQRPRTTDGNDDITFTRHPTLWFDDGNLVVWTHSTMFQVHMSVLRKQSKTWNMHLPTYLHSPEALSEDGKPMVEFNDRPEDLAHLLEAMYNQRYEICISCIMRC